MLVCTLGQLFGQDSASKYADIGIEVQVYPTGFLYGLKAEFGFKPKHALELRLGYNELDHQDFGVHLSEIGGGFGGTIGYRYYFKPTNTKFFLGVRSDIWFNKIEWFDIVIRGIIEGETSVTVLQPTAIFGYSWLFGNHFVLTPTIAAGAEINIITDGAPVGEGPIVLVGINALYRF